MIIKILCVLLAMVVTQIIVGITVEFLHISDWNRGYWVGYITASVLCIMIYGWK